MTDMSEDHHADSVAHDEGGDEAVMKKVGSEGTGETKGEQGEGELVHGEIVAGDPVVDEAVTTSLQLENVSRDGEAGSISSSPSHPVTLLPAPLHLDSHPADALHPPDSPTTSLIASLRSQVHVLYDQAHELNNKLVDSISTGADLEDQLLNLQIQHKAQGEEVIALSKAKAQWEESMNTGLLVERSQIKDEMQRLAAGLVEEERRRGSAEEKRFQVENEVDTLTASLFDQANTMVAAERMGRVQAEARLKDAEENLANAEAAVRDLQVHFQSLPTASVAPTPTTPSQTTIPRRYLSSHVPYSEFIIFLQHLRALRPLKDSSKAMFPPPYISSLLAQPFIARSLTEDHEPTLRLDAAPELSFFTRRSVGQAIVAGELIIEPVSASSVIANASSAIADIGCSLCGKPVFPSMVPQSPGIGSHFGAPPLHPSNRKESRFSLKPFFAATSSPSQSGTTSPSHSPMTSPAPGHHHSSLPSVYIFRIARPPATGISTASSQAAEKEAKSYPLCKSGWCLERLRATCELWHFIRTGIIHVVWHGDDGYFLASEAQTRVSSESAQRDRIVSADSAVPVNGGEVPPALPPRKKSGWGLGFGLKERSGSSGGWGKALYRGNVSEPVSPNVVIGEKQLDDSAVVIDNAGEKGELALGAPLELETEKQNEESVGESGSEKEVPVIHEPEPSPIVETSTTIPQANGIEETEGQESVVTEGQEDETLKAPRIHRNDSTPSVTGSEVDDAAFSTPKGVHTDLSPDPSIPETANDQEHPIETVQPTPVITEQSIPAESTGSSSPTIVSPAGVPPPIPRRAAARDRASKLLDSGSTTPVEEGTESLLKPEQEDSHLNTDTPKPVIVRAPPPLPPRHPKTPTLQVSENAVADGDRGFLGEEGWEVKTWKQVLKIKEEMWKARVGVLDS